MQSSPRVFLNIWRHGSFWGPSRLFRNASLALPASALVSRDISEPISEVITELPTRTVLLLISTRTVAIYTWEDYQQRTTTQEEIACKTREILASSLNVMPNLEVLEVRRVGEIRYDLTRYIDNIMLVESLQTEYGKHCFWYLRPHRIMVMVYLMLFHYNI